MWEYTWPSGGEGYHESLETNEANETVLKQSSSATMALEKVSTLSSEESSNQATACILSLKAATVASEWLELLYQDIKGRFAENSLLIRRMLLIKQTYLFLVLQMTCTKPDGVPSLIRRINHLMKKRNNSRSVGTSTSSAYADPLATGQNILKGVCFASAIAGILDELG